MKRAEDRRKSADATNAPPPSPQNEKDYWDYSMNELAFYDCRAFIERIVEVKKKELGDDNFKIISVAHSMGAGCMMAYLIHSKLNNLPHYLDRVILLAPAGNHSHVFVMLLVNTFFSLHHL